jgi:hypothetical protein
MSRALRGYQVQSRFISFFRANIGSRATPDFAQRPNTNIITLLYLRLLSYTTTLYTNNILMFY